MPLQPKAKTAVALALTALALAVAAHAAPKYKALHSFNETDGAGPWGGVTFSGGKIYGTTLGGGGEGQCETGGCGVVFELTPHARSGWTEGVLHAFGSPGDGSGPQSGVAVSLSGGVFGMTTFGGTHDHGTVYEITKSASGWSEMVLYSFCAQTGCADGGSPIAGPTLGPSGSIYGTAGVAYELQRGGGTWQEGVLHDFTGENGDGSDPFAGVIIDGAGNLYGTTLSGGTGCVTEGCGVVYELTPASGGGWTETVLHQFDNNGKDGVNPGWGALFMDGYGNLYGTTGGGGANFCGGLDGALAAPKGRDNSEIGNCGTIFELTPGTDGHWKEAILYSFKSGATGYGTNAGVVMDKSGNLYGTTDYGGNGCGVIYKLAPKPKGKWAYTVLHTFGVGSDGCLPEGNLAIDGKGNLYGGTVLGGSRGYGIIFELTP